jgi:phosphatidylserine/phosphatidylglycerophosphate/cardiolipin synthase-like enzyme
VICQPPTLPKPGPHVDTVDPAAQNRDRWFLASGPKIFPSNYATMFTDAPAMWAKLAADMSFAMGTDAFIYLLGLDITLDTELGTPGSGAPTLETILQAASGRGVQVRAMLQPGFRNAATVDFITKTLGQAAILDNKRPPGGAHHQKLAIISGQRGTVAYCGGMDIQLARAGWHDMHARVIGPAVEDIWRIFTERWTDHPDSGTFKTNAGVDKGTVISPTRQRATPGEAAIQVVRTYGNGANYSFARNGEHTIYDLLSNAIKQTKEFIYLEDQYLSNTQPARAGPAVSDLLAAKLKEEGFKELVILIARTEALNSGGELGGQGWHRRKVFIDKLRAAGKDKVSVCQYKLTNPKQQVSYGGFPSHPLFVHSKTWIFDDQFTLFGSANCHRQGYTASSEADLGIADSNYDADRPFFAHRLRMDLWMKHLNPVGAANRVFHEKDVADPIACAQYWHCPHPQSQIEPYHVDGYKRAPPYEQDSVKPADAERSWQQFDPDGSA